MVETKEMYWTCHSTAVGVKLPSADILLGKERRGAKASQ